MKWTVTLFAVLAAESELLGIHTYLRNIRQALHAHDTTDEQKQAYIEFQRALCVDAMARANRYVNSISTFSETVTTG